MTGGDDRPLSVPEEDWRSTPDELRGEAMARCAHAVMRGARPEVAWRRAVRGVVDLLDDRPDLDPDLIDPVLHLMVSERRGAWGTVSEDVLDAVEHVGRLVADHARALAQDADAGPPSFPLTGVTALDARVSDMVDARAKALVGPTAPNDGSVGRGEEGGGPGRWDDVPDPDGDDLPDPVYDGP